MNQKNEIDLIEKIIDTNLQTEEIEKQIKDKLVNKIAEETSLLFESFEEKLSSNLCSLYVLFSSLKCEIYGKLPLEPYNIKCEYEDSLEKMTIHLYDNTWKDGLGEIEINMFPKYKGIIKKKKIGYNYENRVLFNGPYVIFAVKNKNIIELKQSMENHYINSLENILSIYGNKNKKLKDYEFFVRVLKELPNYILPILNQDNQERKIILESLYKTPQ